MGCFLLVSPEKTSSNTGSTILRSHLTFGPVKECPFQADLEHLVKQVILDFSFRGTLHAYARRSLSRSLLSCCSVAFLGALHGRRFEALFSNNEALLLRVLFKG